MDKFLYQKAQKIKFLSTKNLFWIKFYSSVKINNMPVRLGREKKKIFNRKLLKSGKCLLIVPKLEFGFDKVKPWNGFWKRMDFRLEWIETLNFTISLLTEKMILNIGMNWKTYSFQFGPGTTVYLLVCHRNLIMDLS